MLRPPPPRSQTAQSWRARRAQGYDDGVPAGWGEVSHEKIIVLRAGGIGQFLHHVATEETAPLPVSGGWSLAIADTGKACVHREGETEWTRKFLKKSFWRGPRCWETRWVLHLSIHRTYLLLP